MKQIRLLYLCTSAAAFVLYFGAGQRCLGETPRSTGISVAAQSIGAPTLYRTTHFFLVSEDDSSTPATLGAVLETIRARLCQAMASRGLTLATADDPLLWICFDDQEQYRQYSIDVECANPVFRDAFYSTRTNHVVFYSGGLPEVRRVVGKLASPGATVHLTRMGSDSSGQRTPAAASAERIEILTHEMAHQLAYNSGLQKRGVMYPLCVSEGLATFFEGCALPNGQAHRSRQRRLLELAAQGRLIPLDQLAVLAGPEGLEPSPVDAYAQFWGLFGFLLERHPDGLRGYLSDLSTTRQGWRPTAALRQDFVKHFGAIESLDRQWQQFVASLSDSIADRDGSLAAASDL